jgi:alkyl hydroperoxide reductase subunit AhpC
MMRSACVLAGVLAAGAAFAEEQKLQIGQEAPPFSLKAINPAKGVPLFALKTFVGPEAKDEKKYVVLSFAASYCEPCRLELAELKKIASRLAASNVLLAVVVIDTDPAGIEIMRKLCVEDLDLPFPVLSDRFGVLARRYAANTLPMTVVVSPDGKVKWWSSGFRPDAIDELMKQL